MDDFKIPTSWAWAEVIEIAETVFGQSPPSSSYNVDGHGLPFFQGKAEFGARSPSAAKWCTQPTREAFSGDILISVRAPVGPTNVADRHCAIGRGLAAIRPSISKNYVRFWLQRSQQELAKKGTGTTFSAISKAVLNSHPIPVAPVNEQRRIVEKIETLFARLDEGEAALRQVQTALKRYRQSVFKAAVTGQLTTDWRAANAHRLESGEELLDRILQARRETWQGRGKYKEPASAEIAELPKIPETWVWATVNQATNLFKNGLSKKPLLEPNDLPILRISAVRPMSVSLEDLRYYPPLEKTDLGQYWVENGDLLFTRYSGSAHFVGVCGQLRGDMTVLHPDKLIKARAVPQAGLNVDFLEIAWNSGETRKHIASNIKTTSGQQGIAGADIKAAPFPLPPPDEQRLIAELVWETLHRIDALLGTCQSELARSTALRQSVLKQAFAGRLVSQNPNDEPATELLARIRETQKQPPKKKATRKKVQS